MGEAFIVRKGGGVATEQALAPTITEVSTDTGTVNFTITNNDLETAVILYEIDNTLPKKNSIELTSGQTSDTITITSLTSSPSILYASANIVGKIKSEIAERSFTFTPMNFTLATGGTTFEYDIFEPFPVKKRYRSHTFTSNGTFQVTSVGDAAGDRNKVDYLIIAGGGSANGGGGGAGGYRTTNGTSGGNSNPAAKVTISTTGFGVTVGASGANSSALSITSNAGGNGGGFNTAGSNGGSGGGGGNSTSAARLGGTGIAGQGFAGGRNGGNFSYQGQSSGGGGGAGVVGNNGGYSKGGNGGNGLANLLRTGSNETRAGGGGGSNSPGAGQGSSHSSGGAGGGGAGNGTPGAVNTGSGGGFASGGSGIVVIRYEILPTT